LKIFLLACCALGLIAAGFFYDKPWAAGLGLLVGFSAMWVDHGHVRVEADDRYSDTSMEVRKMRTKRKA
jgi:hypothetical protein